jgi:hypothetical protein
VSVLHLNAVEGDALRVVEVLVGKHRGALPPKILLESPSPALCEAVGRTLAASCMQMLLSSGGAELRTVLREEAPAAATSDGRAVMRRRTGRLWDPEMNELFDVRFGRASRSFWVATTNKLVALSHRKRRPANPTEAAVTREDKKVVKDVVPDAFDGVGDLLFFALAHENAAALGLPPALEDALRHELRVASPLALLLAPDDPDVDERTMRGLLHTLTAPAPIRCIECLDKMLVESWLVRFRMAVIHSTDRDEFMGRLRAFARVLRTWLALLDGAGRMDLSRSVVRFLGEVPLRGLPAGLDIRNHCLRLTGTSSISQRDEALRALAEVLDVRLVVDDARARLGAERYGDERFEEAQVFLRMIDADLPAERRGPLDAMARTVSGAVG